MLIPFLPRFGTLPAYFGFGRSARDLDRTKFNSSPVRRRGVIATDNRFDLSEIYICLSVRCDVLISVGKLDRIKPRDRLIGGDRRPWEIGEP